MLLEDDLDAAELEDLSEVSNFVEVAPDDPELLKRKHYFVNECVEDLLRRYIWTNCTNSTLRDSIMSYAPELIKQIIRKQNLHMIYPGQEESAFGDLVQTAWVQLERTLYKFRAKPHCRVCYNPDRPISSALYIPSESEYGIITFKELFSRKYKVSPGSKKLINGRKCPYCKAALSDHPDVEPKQGTFGGSKTVLFRGNSKVFNMWCLAPNSLLMTDRGLMELGQIVLENNIAVQGSAGFTDVVASITRDVTDTFKIKTDFGEIEGTPEHGLKILGTTGPEWCQIGSLKIGDLVGTKIDYITTWAPVVSITPSKSPVCEITVAADDHTYIANGFINHNSQVSRTVILAFVKKEGRDRKNAGAYRDHLCDTNIIDEDRLKRFFSEATQLCKFNEDHMKCIEALCYVIKHDDKPYDGLIGKLVERSGLSRIQVNIFIKLLRLRSHEFTDSPLSRENDRDKQLRKQFLYQDEE